MDLLKTRFVFVDTSMYENKNYQFHQHALGSFKELCCEDNLYLLISPIVEEEVRSHLKAKSREAAKHVKEFKKTIKILRNLPELAHHAIFAELKKDDIEEQLLSKFDDFLDDAVWKKIDVDYIPISKIVSKYFNAEPRLCSPKRLNTPMLCESSDKTTYR